ncbi:MAG: alkyl sulfatase dimerization domain-containing protein [Ilumatobacteraceae bacterium]
MRSFDTDPSAVVVAERGQLVHRRALEHVHRLERRLYQVRDGVWSLVGNGLSNQTFIDAPDGIIAIDTGESEEEMRSALVDLREVTKRPVVAVVYTHFHYVSGTKEIFRDAGHEMPVHGHVRIPFNRRRAMSEIGPAYSRGLVYQFGTSMPLDGPDGVVSMGLGLFYRNPAHHPFTDGFVPPTVEWHGGESTSIAGLRVEVTHAPSDADDSVTLWFPDISTCVHNIVWPVLFNIFAIRGEEYRDPQVLVNGIDHILGLAPEHLVGTHGPPISGADEIRRRVTADRDSIQFLWDQTVRGMNKGLTSDEIASTVSLPPSCDEDHLTSELYGVAEHHVRQIMSGMRGWFDGDPAKLFPLEPHERADRLVQGFGGPDEVARLVDEAVASDDLRWAMELATWMAARHGASETDHRRLADVLRAVGYRSSAANIRNWCITTARDLDGSTDLSRVRTHRLRESQILAMSPRDSVRLLRVMLDPERAAGLHRVIGIDFDGEPSLDLEIRNSVSVISDGHEAVDRLTLSRTTWARILSGRMSLGDAIALGAATIIGSRDQIVELLAVFENQGLRS